MTAESRNQWLEQNDVPIKQGHLRVKLSALCVGRGQLKADGQDSSCAHVGAVGPFGA